jgi:ArsR family transcriptional regulator, lead/cadmium/zinc/bismuth-responsive transcriptional repressor
VSQDLINSTNLNYQNCTLGKQLGEIRVIRNELSNKKPLNILEKIEESLEKLNDKIEIMIEIQKNGNSNSNNQKSQLSLPDASLDVMTLLSMPDHLRKTAMVICRCSRATAEEIAEQTKRARAVESAYLNQLVIMGYLKKERKGRKAYFFIDRENQS